MPITVRRLAVLGLLLVTALGWGAAVPSHAQAPPPVVRLALLPQWVIQQHRSLPALAEAIEGGVVDRTVFAWQRGVIQRQALVSKPIRVVPEPGAPRRPRAVRPHGAPADRPGGLDGDRGPPVEPRAPTTCSSSRSGASATRSRRSSRRCWSRSPGGRWPRYRWLAPPSCAGAGVPVVASTFDAPLPPAMAQRFRQEAGLDLLVVRSPALGRANGDQTSSGRADTVPFGGGDWREGDRVFLRISGRRARSRRARDRAGVEGPDAPERPERRVPASLVPAAPRHSLTVAMRPRFLPVARRVA